ncbi:MAG: Trk system potassium transporter TrkA [Gammaproteobacteria bacterium]
MNIIILGAGQVGGTLAETLAKEDYNITLVDINAERLQVLQNRLDIRTLIGRGSEPDILRQAGGENADMLIAVTSSDETNMIACQVAFTLYQTPTKIARIRSNSYLAYDALFQNKAIPIDVCINPEDLVTRYVQRLIEYPGALQVLDFADGQIQLVAVTSFVDGPLPGRKISELRDCLPQIDLRVAAIFRGKRSIPINGDTEIKIGDEVFFITAANKTRELLRLLGRLDNPYRRIMIGGGGHIGLRLAQALEEQYNVKVIDHNQSCAQKLASKLNGATVLCGDICEPELLLDENIESSDVFCAVTNDDEANIMSCIQAKRLGVRKVMALINRTAYVDLVEGSEIDIAISPQQATIGSILRHLRKGDVVNVHSLRRGAAEAIEVIVHGDRETSSVIGRALGEIAFPSGINVGAIARGNSTLIAHHDLVIEPDDHLILFLVDKTILKEVEKLFQVNVNFF